MTSPYLQNVQGGYYLGYLNKKFGYGLAVWNLFGKTVNLITANTNTKLKSINCKGESLNGSCDKFLEGRMARITARIRYESLE